MQKVDYLENLSRYSDILFLRNLAIQIIIIYGVEFSRHLERHWNFKCAVLF